MAKAGRLAGYAPVEMALYDGYATRPRNALGRWSQRQQARRIQELASTHLHGTTARVLEIGPGDGTIGAQYLEQGVPYLGIEGNSHVAEHLRTRGLEIVHAGVPPLPPRIGDFDICFVLQVMEHLATVEAASDLLGDIRDHLRPGGIIVITCPDFLRWRGFFYDVDATHRLPLTMRKLRQLLTAEGLQVEHQTLTAAGWTGFKVLPAYWAARIFYPAFLSDFLAARSRAETLYRGFVTLLPSLLVIARKPEATT